MTVKVLVPVWSVQPVTVEPVVETPLLALVQSRIPVDTPPGDCAKHADVRIANNKVAGRVLLIKLDFTYMCCPGANCNRKVKRVNILLYCFGYHQTLHILRDIKKNT